ncbi:hypothetical protein EDC96DRAFT_537611, partial [Choanephora cucurbitarum]
ELEALQQKYFKKHPKKIKTKFAIWELHLRNSDTKGMKLTDPVDRQVISQECADFKSGQAPGLSELEEVASAFNSTIRAKKDTSDTLKYKETKLQQYSDYLKEDSNWDGQPYNYGYYANSGWQILRNQIVSGLGNRMAEVVFNKLLVILIHNPKLAARAKRKKRDALKYYITQEVLFLLRRHHKKEVNQVNWKNLVDPTRNYRLDPWSRVEGDEVGKDIDYTRLASPTSKN